jgi:UDPglucose 6-dehydrogenase
MSHLPPECVTFASNAYDAAAGSDALLVLTEWKEFAELDLSRLRELLRYPVVIDGRNLYEPKHMADAGLVYYSIGRGTGIPEDISGLIKPHEPALVGPVPVPTKHRPTVTAA